MALLKFEDNSTLDLSVDELKIYLEMTGKLVDPPTEADRVARRISQVVSETIEDGTSQADYVPQAPASPPTPSRTDRSVMIPVTYREMMVIESLKRHLSGLRPDQMADKSPLNIKQAGGLVSRIAKNGRGVERVGVSQVWRLDALGRHGIYYVYGFPSKRWPNP